MSAPIGWLGLIAGEWTIAGDASSCARRTVRAGRALGLRTLAVSTDERCLARLAADGWSLRPASGLDPASIATAFAPAGSRAIAPALLVGDGPGLSDTTARVAALLGARNPDPGAVARSAGYVAGRRTAATPEPGRAVSRYVVQAQDGEVIGIVEDVTTDGRGRDYDCPGSAQGWTARRLRAQARAALDEAGLTRGPVEVILHATGRQVSVVSLAPGRIDGCIASVIELATGHDVILGAVRSAVSAALPPPHRPAPHHARRHACLRRADLRGAPARADAAWVDLPGLVSVRPGADGAVVTVADDRTSASWGARSAVERLAGWPSRPSAVPGGAL
ncbi:acetyl-CoA carboxylase biotin carboxylase subunit family protein [Couchioplanes azureus]|uniref:hypothetical protein n=1 Tax=Couchioplanes caeruleus TaxID=56438 RepID=UPI0016714EBA|nr:hypothetical protein [Couchioplanes caeruleus]GGQ80801.1 hypothetical protein GCM10010166_58620 [Couchioplanes caeruleus subsp. azureus]